jgi:hypothetical protein
MKKLLKNKTITIKYSNLLIGEKSTNVTFSLDNVSNKEILDRHLKNIENKENKEFILNYKFILNIPNSVFKLDISNKEIIIERWWYDKIKNTMFVDRYQAVLLKIAPIKFYKVVKLYLSKNY